MKEALDADKKCYFLGSVMLLEAVDAKPQGINDGQQRLITFSMLVAALCRRFAENSPDTGRETLALRTLFVRPGNETSYLADAAQYESRIEPPRNDKGRYTQLLRGHDIGSNGLLTAAWNRIDRFIESMDRQTREAFFDFLMRRVEISILTIPGDVDSNLVFETLNARGKPLGPIDLIRNWLFSYFSETDDAARLDTVRARFRERGRDLGCQGTEGSRILPLFSAMPLWVSAEEAVLSRVPGILPEGG